MCQASTDRLRLRTEFPLVRALALALASYDGAAELDRGLDLLLPSLAAALTPTDGPPGTR